MDPWTHGPTDLSAQYNRPVALKDVLSSSVRPGELVRPLDATRIRCVACGHRVFPGPPASARCATTRRHAFVPSGYVAGVQSDPIEKKPFFHACPARWRPSGCSDATSIAATARTG